MSKAFTRESEDGPEPVAQRRGVPVPEPNYMTPAGERAARSELASCRDDVRIRELTDHLATAQIVGPPAERDTVSVAARFDSGLNFVKLLGLAGGMPTRVAVPRSRLPELLSALGVDGAALDYR